MSETRSNSSIGLGGASLLMIITILALTAFAVLSISTASAQKRLAERSKEYISSYYEADYAVEMQKLQVYSAMKQATPYSANPAQYWENVANTLKNWYVDAETSTLSYSVMLDDLHTLDCVLSISPTTSEVNIESWQVLVIPDDDSYGLPADVFQGFGSGGP